MDYFWFAILLAVVIFGGIYEQRVLADIELEMTKLRIECIKLPDCDWERVYPVTGEDDQ